MEKKIALFLLVSFMCSSISAQRYFEVSDIRFRVITEADEASTYGTVSVAKPEVGEYVGDIKIPNAVKESNDPYSDAYKVIGIDEKAFAESKYIESVELPASIEHVGREAFRRSSIKKIKIPVGNLTEIEEMVFEESKLESIEIPTTIKKINERAFAYCFDLAEVVIGEGIIDIGKEAFKNCYKIEKVSLPETIRFIRRGSFENCYRINNIVFGANLKSIGDDAFYNCLSLRHVELPEGIKEIGQRAFMQSGLLEIKVPESLMEIKKYVFANTMLRSVSLPQRLRLIEDGAFASLNLNKKVEIPTDAHIAQNAFYNTDFEFGKKQNDWKSFLRNHQKQLIKVAVKDDEVQIIRDGHDILLVVKGLAYCPSAIPLNSAEYGAMRMYGSSYSAVIGRGDEGLGDAYGPKVRFEEIKGDVVIPDVIEIKDGLWKGEYLITEVGSMEQCRTIKKLRLPLTIEKPFEPRQFYNSSITSVNIPEKIVDIPEGLFMDCYNLQEVSLPKNLKSIGDYAFARTLISSIIIPEGTKTIGKGAFSENRKLVNVTLPSNINIGRECFWGTPYGDNLETNQDKNAEKEETNIWDEPKYANDEDFRKYKKQLDMYFLEVNRFLENEKNLDAFPSSILYATEYRRLYRQAVDNINADPWMKSLYNSSYNPYSSYTRKYKQDIESKETKNRYMLP